MNLNSRSVNTKVQTPETVHASERAKRLSMPGGRAADDAVAWYCQMRLRELLQTKNQVQMAKETGVPKSAINLLLNHGRGVGLSTADKFVQILGFETRGQLIDSADTWWATGGSEYAYNWVRQQADQRLNRAKQAKGSTVSPRKTKKAG